MVRPFGEPNIVLTCHTPGGVGYIADNCFRGITPEENERRKNEARDAATRIFLNQWLRDQEAKGR